MRRSRSSPAQPKESAFKNRVFALVRAIPHGETRTYAQIAQLAGKPCAARAVGAILHTNNDPQIPCHL